MEIDSSNGADMLIEPVDEGAHTVVPQLDGAIVETGQNPWSVWVKG